MGTFWNWTFYFLLKLMIWTLSNTFDTIKVGGLFEMCIVPQRVNALWDFADYYILQKCVINESSSKYSGFFSVWEFSSQSRIFIHMETSPLPAKGCKFWPMLGTHGHWCPVSHPLWHGTSFYNGHLRRAVTLTPIAEWLAVELSVPVFAT